MDNLINIANRVIPFDNYRKVVKEIYNTNDIIAEILNADKTAYRYVGAFVPYLAGEDIRSTCRNIWNFLKRNINYKEDRKDQIIQHPGQLVRSGQGDCKSFSVFTIGALRALGIPYRIRFVSYPCDKCGGIHRHYHIDEKTGDPITYDPNQVTHVYTIASDENNVDVIVDAVWTIFNSERPDYIKEKKKML